MTLSSDDKVQFVRYLGGGSQANVIKVRTGNKYFALKISLIIVFACDKYFSIDTMDTILIIFDLGTSNGCLWEIKRISVVTIDFGLKS